MKQAVILAAGEGRRLRPFTVNKPKAMLGIAGKPLIQYVLESLAENGIRDIILVVGYRREQVFDYVGDGRQFNVEVTYVTQSGQLGTAHALAQAREIARDEFLVLPGDKLIVPETLSQIIQVTPPALLVKRESNPSRYGTVTVNGNYVVRLSEKPLYPESNLINTGIYAFCKDFFRYMESELDIPDILNFMLLQGISVTAVETDHPWQDIAYPWDILSLNAAILQKVPSIHNGTIEPGVFMKGQVSIGKGTLVRANSYLAGPLIIGEGCEVGPNVCILPATSIANNVVIAPFSQIKNCVIGNDVHIGTGSDIQDSVIDGGSIVGGHFIACSEETEVKVDAEEHRTKVGAMLGEGCRIGNGVIAQPGVIAGNYCQVKPLKVISGRIPDRSMVI